MNVLVPFDARDPKSRLEPVLDAEERLTYATVLLEHVLETVQKAGHDPMVLATDSISVAGSVIIDDRPLTPAVNDWLADRSDPVAIVMADLGLVTMTALETLFESQGDVVIAPGLAGGTNALVVRDPDFRVDYHGTSFLDHRQAAADIGASVTLSDSFRLAVDVDEPADLVEVLVHAEGPPAAWLREQGFELETDGQRPAVRRT